MKKKLWLVVVVIMLLSMVFVACGKGGDDIELDEDGNIIVKPGAKATTITFWGHGDDVEKEVFGRLVTEFNTINNGVIKVNYQPRSADGYAESLKVSLGGNKAPDVFYVDDGSFKMLADPGLGVLKPLDDFILGTEDRAASKEIVPSEMWATSVDRYRYDVKTTTIDGPDSKYWGVPKDIGPTVLYYNESFFNAAGIKVISVDKEDLADFNATGKDSRGKTKAEYGINGVVGEQGYFVDGSSQKWFNNRIPMSWDESVECARIIQEHHGLDSSTKLPKVYGYFTEWWFSYGWSVGGDCIEYVSTPGDNTYNGGYWDFTLMENTKNYVVADHIEEIEINGNTYSSGQIIAWKDKLADIKATTKTIRTEVLTAKSEGKLVELPSQREAFVEFVRVGQKTSVKVDANLYGYGICPTPTSIGGDAGKTSSFASGKIAMLVDGRWNVPDFRQRMDSKYSWDVAPLPMYRDYNADGFSINRTVTARGIEAGHSGSVALCMSSRTKYENAAWKFIEFIGGRTGQIAQAKSGFAIPSQIDSANSEDFLQSSQNPKNSIIFVRAAEIQTPGDWWYMYDSKWIDSWAGYLNGKVRDGLKTLSDFESSTEYTGTYAKLKAYTKKK